MLYLINVPQWTTTMPPVALTCLSGFFKEEKIPFLQMDFNIGFYNYILSKEYYRKICKYIKPKIKECIDGSKIDINQYLSEHIEEALKNLRRKNKMMDCECLNWSNHIIVEFLKVINEYLNPIHIYLNSMDFGMDNINSYSKLFEFTLKKTFKNLIEIYESLLFNFEIEDNSVVGFSINNSNFAHRF